MMKIDKPFRTCMPGALYLGLLLAAGPAAGTDWQFALDAGTDLVRRGVSYSDEEFIQLRASAYLGKGWFVAASGANVKPASGRRGAQIVANLGFGWPLADGWEAQLAATHYEYVGDAPLRALRYDDLTVTVDYRDLVFFSVATSPNNAFVVADGQIMTGKTIAYDLILRYPFAPGWSAHAGIGYGALRGSGERGYHYGDVGLSRQFARMQANLSYIAVDSTGKQRFGPAASNRWVASLTHYF